MARNKFDIDERLESSFNVAHIKRCMVYIKRYKKELLSAFALNIIAMLLSLSVPLFIRRALDVSISNSDMRELFILSGGLIIVFLVMALLYAQKGKLTNIAGQRIIFDIRNDLFEHLQKLPFSYYDDRPQGKILVRVVNYVNSVSDMLSNGIINVILEVINVFFIATFMFFLDVRLTLIALAGLPVLIGILFIIKPKQRRAWQDNANKSSNLNAYLSESINGIKISQLFVREKTNRKIFARENEKVRKAWIRAVLISNVIWFSADNLAQLVSALVYACSILWFVPMVSVGTLIAMTNYTWRFWQPINNIAMFYNQFINTIAYLERIFETMDEPVLISDRADASTLPEIVGEVEFRNVSFSYELGRNILENVSFKVAAGESIALVGPTGAGKTTVVNLLSRFYDIQNGEILIDGHNISAVTLASLRQQMGIMLQDSVVFSGTVADNIRYGKLNATDQQIEQAARAVNAYSFIDRMQERFETEIKERGSDLSQGQRQLLSFARTFVSDPRILILDEATSSIDTKTERAVQEGIKNLLKGRTSFVIAHRLSTIQGCDRILYIADKGIAEAGSHDELMAKKGLYYKLYISQMEESGIAQ